MSDDITGLCKDHSFESAEEVCRRCGLEFCELCLVYPFGAGKPLCKECAMAEGGVRSHVARAPMARRDLRKKVKAFASRAQRATTNGAAALMRDPVLKDPLAPTDDDLERVPAPVPAAADRAVADAEHSAEEPTTSFETAQPPPAPPVADPADGVAPPIDWNQPFG